MDRDVELCRFLIKRARAMQEQCQALVSECTETTNACSEILQSCQRKYEHINSLRQTSEDLLNLASTLLGTDINPLPHTSEKLLPALVDKNELIKDTIAAASKCLKDIRILGMSEKTVLTWPIGDAPDALKQASILLANHPINIDAIQWVCVVPPEGDTQWTFEYSPFKTGYGVRFSTGHEVIYGLS